jgi:hypothetical protein
MRLAAVSRRVSSIGRMVQPSPLLALSALTFSRFPTDGSTDRMSLSNRATAHSSQYGTGRVGTRCLVARTTAMSRIQTCGPARYLDETVADCARAGVISAGQADPLAVMAWSMAHGLASLWLDGLLDEEYDDPGALAAQITALLESALNSSA